MSNPANQWTAARQARALLDRRLRGSRRGTVASHVVRAGRIAETIWRHWRVGPYRWRLKHVQWYLEHQTEEFTTSTRYRYWLTVRALVLNLRHGQDWIGRLDGPWVRPTGNKGKLGTGRPARTSGETRKQDGRQCRTMA